MGFKALIRCVAVIGKRNEPLYIRSFNGKSEEKQWIREDELKFHYFVHSALDVVEEKVLQYTRASPQGKGFWKPYLGLLCPIENYRVYGYLTNTKLKLIIVLEDSSSTKEGEIIDVNFFFLYFILLLEKKQNTDIFEIA